MEIEVELEGVRWLLASAFLLAVFFFGLIGYWVTPQDGGVLTWSEWQVFQAQRRFRREQALLQAEARRLSDLLTKERDPVRAQLTVRRLQKRLNEVQSPALAVPKARLLDAAQAVLDWTQGVGDYNTAVQSLNAFTDAMDALNEP